MTHCLLPCRRTNVFVLKLMQHLLLETILWNDFSYWTRNTTSLKMGETHSNKYLPCTHQEKEFIGRNKWNKGEAGCRILATASPGSSRILQTMWGSKSYVLLLVDKLPSNKREREKIKSELSQQGKLLPCVPEPPFSIPRKSERRIA